MIEGDVTFHPGWWNRHAGISFNREFFSDVTYRLESDQKMRRLLYDKFGHYGFGEKDPQPRPLIGSDLIASGYLYSGILGCDIKFHDNAPPDVICANIQQEELAGFSTGILKNSPLWQDTLRQVEQLKSQFGYVESHINLQGIQNIALDLRGDELFVDYYDNPQFAADLIRLCTDETTEIGLYLSSISKTLSHGVTAITKKVMPDVYLTSNCTVEMISCNLYREFLLPADIRLSEIFKPFGVHHCGKTMEHVVKGYAEISGLKFAEVGAGSDIFEVRHALPDVFLNLRYSPVKLKDASKDEINKDVREMALQAGSLFSISCVGIDSDTEDQKVENFLDSVSKLNLYR